MHCRQKKKKKGGIFIIDYTIFTNTGELTAKVTRSLTPQASKLSAATTEERKMYIKKKKKNLCTLGMCDPRGTQT